MLIKQPGILKVRSNGFKATVSLFNKTKEIIVNEVYNIEKDLKYDYIVYKEREEDLYALINPIYSQVKVIVVNRSEWINTYD